MRSLSILAAILTVILCLISSARGQQVLWGSTVGVDDCTSGGPEVPLDGGFTFQVGAFFENGVAGWTPSALNTGEWAGHWLAADSAAYNETFRSFTGACVVDPVFAGRQGYIWGFGGPDQEDEWILLSNPGWVFPSGASAFSFPPSWQSSAASVAILGSVDNAPGASVHLQTAAVSGGAAQLPPVPSGQWLGMFFTTAELGNPLIAGWEADFDGDGLSNLMEMAVGGLPRRDSKERLPKLGWVEMGGDYYLSLEVKRAPNVEVDLEAEVSGDLKIWDSGEGAVTVVSEDPASLLVRDNLPMGGETSRYMRLSVRLW